MAVPYVLNGVDYNKVSISQTYDLYLIAGGFTFTTLSKQPTTFISINTGTATPKYQAKRFSGGTSSVKATATVKVQLEAGQTPVAGTIVATWINASISATPVRIVALYEIQSGDTTAANVATGISNTWKAIIDPTNNALPTGGSVRCTNRNATQAEIAAAAQEIFGTDETVAITVATDTITFTYTSVGTTGNSAELGAQVMPSLPTVLPTFTDGIPTNVAGLVPFGSIVGLNNPTGANLVPLQNDQVFATAAQFSGRPNPTYTFQSHQIREDFNLQALIESNLQAAFTSTQNFILYDGSARTVNNLGALIVRKGLYVDSAPDYELIPNATVQFADLNYAIGNIPATQVTITPQLAPGKPIVRRQAELYAAYTF